MSDRERLTRLTNALYGLAVVMFGGTILELIAAKHYQDAVQLVPFAFCGAGIVAVLLAWKRPGRVRVQGLRLLMLATAGGTLLGIWKHVEGNVGFQREMHPTLSGWPLIEGALTGRAPLLASGALAATAAIAVAATFAAGWRAALPGTPSVRQTPVRGPLHRGSRAERGRADAGSVPGMTAPGS
jgi:hypothetical protein